MVESGKRSLANDENKEPVSSDLPPAKKPRTIDINLPNRWEDFSTLENNTKGIAVGLFSGSLCTPNDCDIESKPKTAKPSKKKVGNMKHGSKPVAAVTPSSKTASKQPPVTERDSTTAETAPQEAVESSTASSAAAAPTASVPPVPEDSSTVCKLESTPSSEEGERAEKKSADNEVSEGLKDSTTGTCINPESS